MKKFKWLSLVWVLFLTGCMQFNVTHNVDEEGYVTFETVQDSTVIMERLKEEDGQLQEDIIHRCDDGDGFDSDYANDITERSCDDSVAGIVKAKGKYKISPENFIKKNGYILFNLKEVHNTVNKISNSFLELPEYEQSVSGGLKGVYKINLPGEPVNYREDQEINLFKIEKGEDFWVVSKIGQGENPFTEKLTEENSRNLEEIYQLAEENNPSDFFEEMDRQQAEKKKGIIESCDYDQHCGEDGACIFGKCHKINEEFYEFMKKNYSEQSMNCENTKNGSCIHSSYRDIDGKQVEFIFECDDTSDFWRGKQCKDGFTCKEYRCVQEEQENNLPQETPQKSVSEKTENKLVDTVSELPSTGQVSIWERIINFLRNLF